MNESLIPLPPLPARRPKKIRFSVSEPILRLAERLAEEKRLLRAKIPTTPAAPDVAPKFSPRSKYRHKRVTAVLSVRDEEEGGIGEFALDNGVYCCVGNGGPLNIAKQLVEMRVRTLHCFDEASYQIWCRVLERDYEGGEEEEEGSEEKKWIARIKAYRMKAFSAKPCEYCSGGGGGKSSCPVWNANAGISRLLGVPFDPLEHSSFLSPEPVRRQIINVLKHGRVSAVLAVGGKGFTLTNGVESVSVNKTPSNSALAREVLDMRVRVLDCFDERTRDVWNDVHRSYAKEFKKLRVSTLKPVEMRKCISCGNEKCHRWKASVGISHRYRLRFDPVEH